MHQELIIKKYPNRRLYDTENSSYLTLKDLGQKIKQGRQIKVIDVKTEEDVTSFILVQILTEQVKQNSSVLPVSLLHLIIKFEENVLGDFFANYLEKTIESYLCYKKSVDKQIKACIELGLDFSLSFLTKKDKK